MEENIENLIEELTKVRPEMLNEEALKLFNTIMAILDERDKLREENNNWKKIDYNAKLNRHITEDYIPKSKIKEFFTSRLEKYQEADDGSYEQDYLTRGELELVDRYKESKEIAKIILEEEIEAEIPQDCIPKSKIKEILDKAEVMDYYTLPDVIEDLENLLK